MDILAKIAKLRDERGWTNHELCLKSGVAYSTISSNFRKNQEPSVTTIERLCQGFGITVSQFFADAHLPLDLTEEQAQMLEGWNRLNEQQKQALLALIKTM